MLMFYFKFLYFCARKICRHDPKVYVNNLPHNQHCSTFLSSSSSDPVVTVWGPGVHFDRPGASPPTLWLIHCWAVSSTTLSLLWQPQPIATWQTSHGIKWRKWKREFFRAWLCANHCQQWVVHDRRQQRYVSSAAIVLLWRSRLCRRRCEEHYSHFLLAGG